MVPRKAGHGERGIKVGKGELSERQANQRFGINWVHVDLLSGAIG